MNATKKTYEAPEMEVVEIEQADIIATSNPQPQFEEWPEITL